MFELIDTVIDHVGKIFWPFPFHLNIIFLNQNFPLVNIFYQNKKSLISEQFLQSYMYGYKNSLYKRELDFNLIFTL